MAILRKQIFAVLAICLGLIAATLIAEISARIILPKNRLSEIIRPSADPLLGEELVPGAKILFAGGQSKIAPTEVVVSSQGFRDHMFPERKPANKFRIACLGDSFAFGWGVNQEQAYPKQLELSLANLGISAECINMGVPGYGLSQEVRLLKTKGLKFEPDLAIFGVVGDDLAGSRIVRIQGSPSLLIRWIRGRSAAEKARNAADYVIVEKVLNDLVRVSAEHHLQVKFVLLTGVPDQNRFLMLLKERNFEVRDLSFVIEDPNNQISSRDHHPNAKAHHLYAEKIAEQIFQMNLQQNSLAVLK